jgi:hypothetical protein
MNGNIGEYEWEFSAVDIFRPLKRLMFADGD